MQKLLLLLLLFSICLLLFSIVLDSGGKLPPGLAYYNTRWLGFYDECTRAEKIIEGKVKIKGKYCKAKQFFVRNFLNLETQQFSPNLPQRTITIEQSRIEPY